MHKDYTSSLRLGTILLKFCKLPAFIVSSNSLAKAEAFPATIYFHKSFLCESALYSIGLLPLIILSWAKYNTR